ncbi:MAG: biotin--[acetyl-CoA-carboxylase] ligase [Acidimicrobiales bacterium]
MPASRFADVRRFDELDSTNRYLLDEARRGAPDGVVVVADHQSAGRGRLGRRWEAPPGACLLASVLVRPHLPLSERYLTTACVALAAAEAAAEVGGVVLGVKWPNDLLASDGRKVAGVLAEAEGDAVVVGIGVNVTWPTDDADLAEPALADLAGRATSLVALAGRVVPRGELLDGLLAALEPRAAALDEPAGRRRLAAELRSACTTLGARVRVDLADEHIWGTAVDLTADGRLVVETTTGRQVVSAGDVTHLRTTG